MPRQVDIKLELPDEIGRDLRDEEIAAKVKEAFIMALLREHDLSQGKAAELLGINRHNLFDLMTKYRIPVIDLTPEEMEAELKQ